MKLKDSGPVARAAAADALLPGNLSVRETGGNNRGKWVLVYLAMVGIFEPAAWCCAWYVFRMVKASQRLGIALPKWFKKTGYCPTLVNAAKANDCWIHKSEAQKHSKLVGEGSKYGCVELIPQPGDACCFWFESKGRIAHIGIVTAVESWGVWTCEGNTGSDGIDGVQRDGDGVYRKKREWAELGAGGGFIRVA